MEPNTDRGSRASKPFGSKSIEPADTDVKYNQRTQLVGLELPAETKGFTVDELMNILLGGHLELLTDYVSAIIKAGIVGGEVYVAEDASGTIVGAAVWFPPGKDFLDSEDQANAGYNDFMTKLTKANPDMLTWWTDYFGPLAAEFVKKTFGDPNYGVKCWYLYLIGIQPARQQRGVGTALMNDAEAKIRAHPGADKLSKTVALGASTKYTFEFYKRKNFIEKGRFDVKSIKELNETLTMRFYTKVVD